MARPGHAPPPSVHGLASELRGARRRRGARVPCRRASGRRWGPSSSPSGLRRTRSTSSQGHPLRTNLSDRTLAALAVAGLAGAVAIGIAGLFVVSASLAPFVVVGPLIVLAYNLELFGGRFHNDFWFAAAWGAFPALTGFWVMALGIHSFGEAAAGVLVTLACFGLSVAQRRLSTPARELRRRTVAVSASSGSPTAPPGAHRRQPRRPAGRRAGGPLGGAGHAGRGPGRDPALGLIRTPLTLMTFTSGTFESRARAARSGSSRGAPRSARRPRLRSAAPPARCRTPRR